MAPTDIDLDRAFAAARAAARAGADAALAHFRSLRSADISRKADRSLVTVADHEAEQAIVRVIRDAFPEHAILGEEGGEQAASLPSLLEGEGAGVRGASGARDAHRWIIDPIDGTRAFASGGDYWGPLIALESPAGEILVGVAILPALGREYWASRGAGCFRNGARVALAPADAPPKAWTDAVLSMGSMPRLLNSPQRGAIIQLAQTCAYAYAGCDLAGCLLVLDSVADVWIETGVQVWDIAALKLLIEEAGGVFTDHAGASDLTKGDALAGSPHLHSHALHALNTEEDRD